MQQIPALHTWPDPQPVPLLTLVQLEPNSAGWQVWQALAGFAAPAAKGVESMKQPT
jgi:hypothetical protein